MVGETHTGNLWAIQVKCYIDTQVPLDEIQGFISLSGREEFGVRLLISVGDLSENARIHIKKQDKPVQALFYPELNKSPVDWLDYFVDGEWVTFEGEDIFIKSNEQELRDYRKEIELNPDDPDIYIRRARYYTSNAEDDKAIDDYNIAIKLDPKNWKSWNERGERYMVKLLSRRTSKLIEPEKALKGFTQALEDFTKAIELNPDKKKQTYVWRGSAYYHLEQYEKAINDQSKAIELDPRASRAYYNRGRAYAKLGNHKKAIDDYSESIELEHGFVAVYLSRAESYEKLGEDEKAKADHIKAEEIKNNKK